MTRQSLIPWVILGAILVYVAVDFNGDLADARETEQLNALNDSARVQLAALQVSYDSVASVSGRVDTVVIRSIARANRALVTADSLQRVRTALNRTLALATTARDSLDTSLRVNLVLRAENDSLRSARRADSLALDLMTADRNRWRGVAGEAREAAQLADAALQAERDARACRLLGTVKMPCVRLPGFVTDGLKVGLGVYIGTQVAK